MKGKFFRRVLCMIFAAVLMLSICACGNKKESNNMASKMYVYSYEDIDLGLNLDNASVTSMSYVNDKIYVLLQDYSGQYSGAASGARTAVVLPEVEVMPEVDAEDAVVEDVIIDDGIMEEEEYVYYGPVYVLVSAKLDGSDKKEVVLSLGEKPSQNSWMNRVLICNDGTVIGTQEEYMEDYSDPNNPIYETYNFLMKWDMDGNLLWKKDMAEYIGDEVEYYYPRDIFSLNDGSIAFISYEGIGAVVDADGKMLAPITLDSELAMNMANIFRKSDGTTYVTGYNNEYTKMFICTIDLLTGETGEKQDLPGTLMNYNFRTGYNTDFILTNNIGVYTYNVGDEAPVQIMDFINSDFPSSNINTLIMLDDTHMIGYYNDQTDWKPHFAYFTQVNPENVPEKTTLILGCNYLDYEVRKRVVEFNKTNEKYRISVKDYSTFSSVDDYNAGNTQLNNDIISRQMPDILVVNTSMNTGSYISKGAFADLSKLIEQDEELSQVEFLPNVMEAFSVDGKLYTLVPSFSIRTMIGKKSILGDRSSWNINDMMELANTLPEGSSMFSPEMMRDSFLYQVLSFLGNDFVDPQTGKCSFDSQEFISLLEFAKTFPAQLPEDYWEDYDWSLYESMYREDKAILMECYMSSISDLKYQIKGQFGEEVSFIGFPSSEGNGSVLNPSYLSFALSAESKNMEGAWEFIRYYLTDEYQMGDQFYEFPVNKKAFHAKAQKAMEKPYWTDENGNKVEYEDTYWINGEEIILEPFTQDEVDEICDFIYSVTKVGTFNNDIRTIITEEAASFFEGQKSAQEVAKIIQSRAQVFIDENR